MAGFVGDHAVFGEQRVSLAVEGEEGLAVLRAADHQRAADFRGVKGVQRLADLVEHEVGDVDDVVDRAQADRFEPLLQPGRAFADGDAGDADGGVEGAGFRGLDVDAFRGETIALGDLEVGERDFEQGRHFARHAVVAQQVGAVRGDLDFEQHVVVEEFLHRLADGRVGGEDHQAIDGIDHAEFAGGAEHALRFDAAHLRLADREAAGQRRAGQGAGDLVADLIILRAANDLAELAFAGIDLGDLELVGVRVLDGFHDLRDDDLVRGDALHLDAFDFHAGEGKELVEFLGRFAFEVDVGGEPVQ